MVCSLPERCGDIDLTAEGSQFMVFMIETHKTDAKCVGAECLRYLWQKLNLLTKNIIL